MKKSSQPCPFFRQKGMNNDGQPRDKNKEIAWRDFLEVSGEDLWTIRNQALQQTRQQPEHSKEGQGESSVESIFCLPLNPTNQNTKYVAVMTSVAQFLELEQNHGMDKMHSLRNQNGYRPLTQTLGYEWVRARRLFKSALGSDFSQRSLNAVQMIPLDQLLLLEPSTSPPNERNVSLFRQSSKSAKGDSPPAKVDLLQIIHQISVHWIVALLQGCPSPKLERVVSRYWSRIRGREACPPRIEARARQAVLQTLDWEKEGSLLQSLASCGFSWKERQDNALNVLSAAMDAIQCILFWTVWNLSSDGNTWKKCQEEWKKCMDSKAKYECDLELLAEFKKLATQGAEIALDSRLSLLGRALAETVRVYPPVWTLPRRWPGTAEMHLSPHSPSSSEIISIKADVPSINRATDRLLWNPFRTEACPVASFGLGERSCPAGTAALVAAYHILHRMVTRWETPHWLAPERAVANAYLGPSLCVEGPQEILVRPLDSRTRSIDHAMNISD